MKIGIAGVGRIGAFHARTLQGLPGVDEVVVADVNLDTALRVSTALGLARADSIEALLDSGVDGFVITTGTQAHAELLEAAMARGIPTFCEKPVALELERTVEIARLEHSSGATVHIGFQRRFDVGYRRAKAALESGELGFLHTIRCTTNDAAPPAAAYIPTSGGIFRDCNVHDFDILRFVTGREVVSAYAVGGNKGADFFREGGDVDSGAALLTLDDGTVALVSSTRYNGGGHDVRMELHGSKGTLGVGHDGSLAIRSAEDGVAWPPGPVHESFMDRFLPAYVAELTAFAEVVRGERPSPCTVADALEASRTAEACARSLASGQPVALSSIPTL